MGKRELLLIAGFVIVGTVVYYATAPEGNPGGRSFSISQILDHVRREVRGRRFSVEVTRTETFAVSPSTTELRFSGSASELTITGEDRADVAYELRVWSDGHDDAEAKELATATVLLLSEAGGRVNASVKYPDPGTQRAFLTLRVPSRLRVQLSRTNGTLAVSTVSTVECIETRGETTISNVSGRVVITHRGGDLNISDVAALKLTTRGSDIRIQRVSGEAFLQTQAGEIRASELGGPIEIESNQSEVTLEKFDKTRGPIRITTVGGHLTMNGLRSDARVDARNTEIKASLDRAATIAIFSEGSDPVEVVVPPGGFTLDALANDGEISVPDKMIDVKETEREQRASGAIKGGGPTLTLRATHGDIVLRAKEITTH
jgi:hypothetical protein